MNKPLLFLDTEFNGYGGQLISMGITSETGHEFYKVLDLREDTVIDLWVEENVIPFLLKGEDQPSGGTHVSYIEFQRDLEKWLNLFKDGFTIVADWPGDIKYFCETLITAAGKMLDIPSFKCRVERVEYLVEPVIRHHALEDARALKKTLFKMHNFRLYP